CVLPYVSHKAIHVYTPSGLKSNEWNKNRKKIIGKTLTDLTPQGCPQNLLQSETFKMLDFLSSVQPTCLNIDLFPLI
ncbi:hypothetical protein, partial [Candidatus Parabeggiatoa sp. HSG14]|uniref:hypothetical protein n=1 Tax=Candidatus Parabeggiatoa sp. HSG14 TaxID=3055593 RepID=UPI0025A8452F|nr:hypothetical protein [Thiotrichales bacterium HSG14]